MAKTATTTAPETPPAETTPKTESTAVTPPVPPSETPPTEPVKEAVSLQPFKFPEGITVSEDLSKELMDLASAHKFTQDGGQAIVDLHLKMMKTAEEASDREWQSTRQNWKKAFDEDADYGGNNLVQSNQNISRALDAYGEPELVKWLDDSGIGDHPLLRKLLTKVGSSLREGKVLFPTTKPTRKLTREERLNPTLVQ